MQSDLNDGAAVATYACGGYKQGAGGGGGGERQRQQHAADSESLRPSLTKQKKLSEPTFGNEMTMFESTLKPG